VDRKEGGRAHEWRSALVPPCRGSWASVARLCCAPASHARAVTRNARGGRICLGTKLARVQPSRAGASMVAAVSRCATMDMRYGVVSVFVPSNLPRGTNVDNGGTR
jgi:hypothetical protein